MNATLVMPPVDLPEGASYLQFKQWHNFEQSIFRKSLGLWTCIHFHGHGKLDTTTNDSRCFKRLD